MQIIKRSSFKPLLTFNPATPLIRTKQLSLSPYNTNLFQSCVYDSFAERTKMVAALVCLRCDKAVF